MPWGVYKIIMEILEGWGGGCILVVKKNGNSKEEGGGLTWYSLHGGGMDIFWNYTMHNWASKNVSMTVSVTCKQRCRKPVAAWVSEDKWKERLEWFHTTFWIPGTGHRVILFVGLWSYDAHLSVTFIIDVQWTPNSVAMFVSYIWYDSYSLWHLPLLYIATFPLVLYFTHIFEGLLY